MSEPFSKLVSIVRDEVVLAGAAEEDHQRQYLNAPERMREAEEAEPCVERFVDYEFDPPKGKGAGRGRSKWAMAEPLAKSLSKQLGQMDPAQREWMRDTVTGTIAFGYVAFCLGQSEGNPPSPAPGGDPRQLWERWMLGLSSDALDTALTEGAKKAALQVGHFENTMKKHGVYKLKTAPVIKMLSTLYGRAGLSLRLFQSTSDFDIEPHKSVVKALPNWPFERSGAPAG